MILGAGLFAQTSFAAVSVGLAALAPALRSHYRLSLGETGVVLGAVGIGMLPTLLPWGLLADRSSERLLIALGLGGSGVAVGAAGTTHSFSALVGWLVVAGALGASVNAASGRAVMWWFAPEERGLALGIRQTAIPIGGAAAAAGLPWLASAGGTRLAFLVLGCWCIGGALVAGALMREAPVRPPELGDVTRPARDPKMWLLAGGSALYLTAQIALTGFVVLFLHEHRGMSAHTAAALFAGINVLGIGARIGSGRWSDRLGTRLEPLRRYLLRSHGSDRGRWPAGASATSSSVVIAVSRPRSEMRRTHSPRSCPWFLRRCATASPGGASMALVTC